MGFLLESRVPLVFATQEGSGFQDTGLVFCPFANRDLPWTWWLESTNKYYVALEHEWSYDRLAGLAA